MNSVTLSRRLYLEQVFSLIHTRSTLAIQVFSKYCFRLIVGHDLERVHLFIFHLSYEIRGCIK